MKRKFQWFVVSYVIATVSCMFFHEPSFKKFNDDRNIHFGYSIGFQEDTNNLVIGGPNDKYGHIFKCPLAEIFSKTEICQEIPMDSAFKSLDHEKRINDDYKFMLGASLATLNKSIVTCAPMWSGEYDYLTKKEFFVWGACFKIAGDGKVSPLSGLYGHPRNRQQTIGSFGWSTWVDRKNNLLLISKPATPKLIEDLIAIPIDGDELGPMKSLVLNEDEMVNDKNKKNYHNILLPLRNFGTAMASGNFWRIPEYPESVIYAVSFTTKDAVGGVMFLQYKRNDLSLLMNANKPIVLNQKNEDYNIYINSMFGAALCAVELGYEYTYLVVGSPAQTGLSWTELGAVHIYSHKDVWDPNMPLSRKITIWSKEEESRFGSSIIANDLDNDGLQEIFVSAPYEKEGALYIFSGYEIKKQMESFKKDVEVKRFTHQKIEKKEFQLLGFSVATLTDLDNNGCDELAIGAPNSNVVMIFRCIPTVDITVTPVLVGYPKIVPETVNQFQIEVCLNVKSTSNMDPIAASVLLINTIESSTFGTKITCDLETTIDISIKKEKYCEKVTVNVEGNEVGLYTFKTNAQLINKGLDKAKSEFDRSWVRIGPYSEMSNKLSIERGCSGDDCTYSFKDIEFKWSGGEVTEGYEYPIGSKDETLTVRFTNEGRIALTACAMITVVGAAVETIQCPNNAQGYQCKFQAAFKKNTTRDINMKLKTSRLTNEYKGLEVNVTLFYRCDDNTTSLNGQFLIDYKFNTDDILIEGVSEKNSITEKVMSTTSETIDVSQVYTISNKGPVQWKDLVMTFGTDKPSLIKQLKVTSEVLKCNDGKETYTCTLDLEPSSSVKINVILAVWVKKNRDAIVRNRFQITSNLKLTLNPTSVVKTASALFAPVFEKDSTIGTNKTVIILIALILAIILFCVFMIILYKFGFFKRKQKEQMEAEIKRRSVRRPQDRGSIEIHEEELHIEDRDDIYICGPSTSTGLSKRISRKSISKEIKDFQRIPETGNSEDEKND